MIDPADIGAVAAAALTESGHDGAEHRLSGPQALTPPEQVEIVAAATGRPLRFEGVPDDVARAELRGRRCPPRTLTPPSTSSVASTVAELESAVTPTVEQVLGRPAGTLAAWAERNAAVVSERPRDYPQRCFYGDDRLRRGRIRGGSCEPRSAVGLVKQPPKP